MVQQDTPIYSEWVAVLDGYVNAQIQPHVSGYIIKQNYKEGSVVSKGQVLFEIDPRPFKAALDQAKAAAGGKDVGLWGGADVAGQYLAAGLLDELELHVVPVVLGDGARLFENLGDAEVRLEQVRAVEAPGVTHVKYRAVR